MGLILSLEFGQGGLRLSGLAKPLAMGDDERDVDQGWWLAWTKALRPWGLGYVVIGEHGLTQFLMGVEEFLVIEGRPEDGLGDTKRSMVVKWWFLATGERNVFSIASGNVTEGSIWLFLFFLKNHMPIELANSYCCGSVQKKLVAFSIAGFFPNHSSDVSQLEVVGPGGPPDGHGDDDDHH
ncbi:hypothetical protein SO802_005695 [Lithocarpus litseifolius]|uniref:Uncharacterized protein n=1 Tax=Lithocarpus litseifolius TaxID=425828 RepID=A0AAW2DJ94_9ROSI